MRKFHDDYSIPIMVWSFNSAYKNACKMVGMGNIYNWHSNSADKETKVGPSYILKEPTRL